MRGNALFAIIAMAIAAASGLAQASEIRIQTAYSTAGPQADADAYRSLVDADVAPSSADYGSGNVASYDHISSHGLFGGPFTHIAFKSTVKFYVAAADAGPWEIRSGVDFGNGGAIFLDGIAFDSKTNDMWWHNSYSNPTQIFDISPDLGKGNHVLNIYGLEDCCDGGQQAQFRIGDGQFVTFGLDDGLHGEVPEPASCGLLAAGLGLVGWVRRRGSGAAGENGARLKK